MTVWHILILARALLAQTTTKPTSSSTTSTPPFLASSSSSSLAPGASPNPNGNNGNSSGSGGGGLDTYYAVGLALLLCCVALALFFMFRRRILDRGARRRNDGRGIVLQRDIDGAVIAGDPSRGRGYLIGLPRLRQPARQEEGLDERGEAPPQYISKTEWEQLHPNGEASEPGIPLQTLSRDAVGLKPPDYSEAGTQEAERNARGSTVSASSSRAAEHGANP